MAALKNTEKPNASSPTMATQMLPQSAAKHLSYLQVWSQATVSCLKPEDPLAIMAIGQLQDKPPSRP